MNDTFRTAILPRVMALVAAGAAFTWAAERHFLLFHGLAEMAAIGIGFGVFFIVVSTRRLPNNAFHEILGHGLFFTALIDLLHTFAYKGMNVFPGADANLPTQLWLAGRFLMAGTFLAAPAFLRRDLPRGVVLGAFMTLASALTASVFLGWFPDAYIEGRGLTGFKVVSEYAVCGVMALSSSLLWGRRELLPREQLRFLLAAIACTIVAELAFTFYVGVYDISNIVGHYFKFLAFYCIYKALVQQAVASPRETLLRESMERDRALTERSERQEEELASIFNHAQVGLALLRGGRTVARCNQRLADILGYSSPEAMKDLPVDAVHLSPEHFRHFGEQHYESLRYQDNLQVEYQLRRADGTAVWCTLSGAALDTHRPADLDKGVLWVVDDIGARKSMETDLKESAQRFHSLFHLAPVPLCYVAFDGTVLDVNRAFSDLFGYARTDVPDLDHWWRNAYPDPAYRKEVLSVWGDAVRRARMGTGDITPSEYVVSTKGGGRKVCLISGTIIGQDFLATFFDVTDRKRHEERIHSLLESIPAFVVLLREDFTIAFANKRFTTLFGPAGDGETCHRVMFGRDKPCPGCPTIRALRKGEPHVWELDMANGTSYELHDLPFTDADGQLLVLEMGIEITERKEAERRLERANAELELQASELRSANADLDQYAYAVSHDLKAPLRAIHNYSDFLLEDLDRELLSEEVRSYLDGITTSVRRSEELVEDLLTLSRLGKTNVVLQEVELTELVHGVVRVMGLDEDAEVEVGKLPTVRTDSTLLSQIVANLVDNGLKFNTSTPRRVRVSWKETGDTGLLRFEDNGIGIEEQYFPLIFRLFQRLHTLSEYPGTGLGLAIVRRAADRLGCVVELDSTPGRGSRFSIVFPLQPQSEDTE